MSVSRVENALNTIYESQRGRFVLLAFFLNASQIAQIKPNVVFNQSVPGSVGRWRGVPVYVAGTDVTGMPTGTRVGELNDVKYSYLELAVSD